MHTRFHGHASRMQSDQAQRTHDLTSRMREIRMSGSVGAPGGQLPGATRPKLLWIDLIFQANLRPISNPSFRSRSFSKPAPRVIQPGGPLLVM
jgi:hypothetical protein